ncbi:MAG: DUF2911 domain-containing protein [Ferruginibacter sp.]|nr:DUF2911 domain-containing protein [Ferruginibacter sp.]
MKNIFSILIICLSFATPSPAQEIPIDKSPLDIAYFPVDYPLLKIQGKAKGPAVARIIYSRPLKNGREIFGNLIEYNKIWRLGANEATEIEFFVPVTVNHTKIKRGRYTLYAIPDEEKWTIIINKETDTWGTFKYDKQKDIVRIEAPTEKRETLAEYFTAAFEPDKNGFNLLFAWDGIGTSISFSL